MEAEVSTKLHRPRQQQQNGEFLKQKVTISNEEPKRSFTWGQCLKYKIDPYEFYKSFHELPKICTDATVQGTPVQEFYSGAHILITGATGFMGKLLVEKLLVSCPKLSKLYVIIRDKKGQTVQQRFDQLFNDDVFIRLKAMVPNFREKIEVISGDCSKLRMGVADEDYQRLSNILTHVFHGAATVRFDEKLRTATHINIRGVREMIQLCHKCKHLKSVVHVSTAYANSILSRKEVDEKFYPPACDYKSLMQLVDTENDDTLTKMTPELIKPYPNSYAFTKQIAEDVIRTEAGDLPLCVFRPAIVVASYKEPVRAYCDNIYGPTGVILGVGTGVLRVMHCNREIRANLVPVDTATNGIIAAAWRTANEHKKAKDIKIYNYVSSERNPMTWGEYADWGNKYGRRWYSVAAIWYPIIFLFANKSFAAIATFFLHTIPAHLVDCYLYTTGQETKLIKAYQKIDKFVGVISYFANNSWDFSDKNTLEMWNELGPKDKEIFPFDIFDVSWDFFSHVQMLGLRWYLVKDPVETLQAGRAKNRRLYLLNLLVCGVLMTLVLAIFAKFIGWSFF